MVYIKCLKPKGNILKSVGDSVCVHVLPGSTIELSVCWMSLLVLVHKTFISMFLVIQGNTIWALLVEVQWPPLQTVHPNPHKTGGTYWDMVYHWQGELSSQVLGCSQTVCLHWLIKILASLVGWYSRDELWHVKFCRKAWEGKGTSSKKLLGRDLKSCGSKRPHWNLSWRLQQVPESAALCFHVWKSQKILRSFFIFPLLLELSVTGFCGITNLDLWGSVGKE